MSRMLARSWLFRSPVPRTGTTLVLGAARRRHPRLYSAQHPSHAAFTSTPPLRRHHGTTQQVEEAAAESTAPAGSDTLASALISTSSVLSAVREYRQKYPGCVLLVRVGDFYELYFDHADDIGGDLLGLQVVNKKFRNGTVRFTGFPARSLDRYLEILVARHGLNVALCEQFQEPMRRVFTRKVTRVVTPGTLIDEQYASSTRMHNYIVSIARIDPRSIEHQQMIDRWQRDKAAIEERHAADISRIIAEAKRKWEMERELLEARQKRRGPGRPRKHQSTIPIDFLLAEEFDPSSVCVPDPPEIPPRPDFSIDASSDPSTIDVSLSLAWLDLATGDFMTCSSSPSSLPTDLARIRPREILVDESDYMVHDMVKAIYPCSSTSSQITGQPAVTHVTAASFHQWSQPQVPGTECESNSAITDEPEERHSNSLNPNVHWQLSAPSQSLITTPDMLLLEATELSSCEQTAARALLNYVLDTQLGLLPPLQPPKRYQVKDHMKMSAATIQALELVRPQLSGDRGSSEHTLLAEIDYTKTSSGARLLAKRLTAPSTSIDIIEQRMDLLEFFSVNSRARELVREHLERISDIERAVNKLSLNCGGPHDLLDIARTLQEVTKIKQVLEAALVPKKQPVDVRRRFSQRKRAVPSYRSPEAIIEVARRKATALQALMPLVRNIESKIRVDAERDIRVFGFLKPNCSTHLTHLHEKLKEKNRERHQMQETWISRYHCSSLKLETLSNIGHFIEVSKRDASTLLDSSDFRMIQTLKSKVRFENAEWTYLLSEIEMVHSLIRAEELRVFEELRDSVLEVSSRIRTNSRVLAELDVAISMAVLAARHQFSRPQFVTDRDDRHSIIGGRHPIVEAQLISANRQFVANDCTFNADSSQVLLLTGPNMGGKSTYLRQVALISILAQTGSFVPANEAQLHVVDAIYSRIGAHDNLALDQSTFMVEMSETADILRHATSRSLVILDEIGRGTSTRDGVSIAYATLKYLHDKVRCKALFATHYHELVPHAVPSLAGVQPLHTAIYEDGEGGFAFLHKVKPGICERSHGLYVAQIAGMPDEVLETARQFAIRRRSV